MILNITIRSDPNDHARLQMFAVFAVFTVYTEDPGKLNCDVFDVQVGSATDWSYASARYLRPTMEHHL